MATTFFIELGTAHVEHIAPLAIDGIVAAPFRGYIVRHVPPHALMAVVGAVVSAIALFQLIKSSANPTHAAPIYNGDLHGRTPGSCPRLVLIRALPLAQR